MAISYDDVVAPAKILAEFIKDLETIKVRSARRRRQEDRRRGVKALAKLPGLPELRAKLLGMINQPAGKLVRTIAAPGSAARARARRLVQSRSASRLIEEIS